eukprot:364758-Chlamydomonas_euryale.AAC.5
MLEGRGAMRGSGRVRLHGRMLVDALPVPESSPWSCVVMLAERGGVQAGWQVFWRSWQSVKVVAERVECVEYGVTAEWNLSWPSGATHAVALA